MITLKVTKNQGFTLSLEDAFLEKPKGGIKLIPPPPAPPPSHLMVKSIGTHWIALYVNGNNLIYFESFGVEHISKEI